MKKIKLLVLALVAFVLTANAADVTISWPANPPSEQAEYLVEYRVNGVNPWIVIADNLTTNSVSTNLADGFLYEFRAAAKNITGTSAYSANVSPPSTPDQPAAPTVIVAGNSVTVSWLASPAEQQAKYKLEYRANNVGSWIVLGDDLTVTSFSQAFSPGALYSFRVLAKNISGSSAYSIQTDTPPVPSVPGPLTVTVD